MRSDQHVVRCSGCGCEYRVPPRQTIMCPTCGHDTWVLARIPIALETPQR